MVPPASQKDTYFLVLGISLRVVLISRTRLSLSMVGNSMPFRYLDNSYIGLPQPPSIIQRMTKGFRLFPLSLSATDGITIVLFSTPYWDVSVQMVPSTHFNIPINRQLGVWVSCKAGRVSPFGHRRIIGFRHLPDEFRCLIRPSSVLHTKASTVCVSKT